MLQERLVVDSSAQLRLEEPLQFFGADGARETAPQGSVFVLLY